MAVQVEHNDSTVDQLAWTMPSLPDSSSVLMLADRVVDVVGRVRVTAVGLMTATGG